MVKGRLHVKVRIRFFLLYPRSGGAANVVGGCIKVFFLVCEKIPVGSEKSGFRKYRKYRPKYR
jgi:hypothetical protein